MKLVKNESVLFGGKFTCSEIGRRGEGMAQQKNLSGWQFSIKDNVVEVLQEEKGMWTQEVM